MMLRYFQRLVSALEKKIDHNVDQPNARRKYALEIARLGKRLYSGEDRVAWCGVLAPFDLLNAMGITSCYVEFVGAVLANTGMGGQFLEEAETAGYALESCGYHRGVLGAELKGLMPVPDVLIGTSAPCTGGLATIENLSRRFGKGLTVLHIPQEADDHNVKYLASQYKDMTRFVTEHTGRPLDQDRLRQAIVNTNETREIMLEMYELAQRVPSPLSSKDLKNYGIVAALFMGAEAGLEVARAFRDEFAIRAQNGESGVPEEKFRLLWIQNRIQFKQPLDKLLEKEYSANIVTDELNSVTWDPIDPDDPYEGLARRAITLPICGPVDRRIDLLKELARAYKVHGAINPCHWGCRGGSGARGLISDGLKEIGVPVLNLEVDCIDSRNFSEGQIRTRIEAFMETLDSRPSPWN
jgi:benzoyl-CoA reductase/2-hydroxyglutaryl-CoA dehydratase subunit BcrC/BadD/HgdB